MTDDRPSSILDALTDHPELRARVESIPPLTLDQLERAWRESGLSAADFVRELLAAPDRPDES